MMDLTTRPLEIAKVDVEQRLAFGWIYTVDGDGVPVVDRSGDVVGKVALGDLEGATYSYVLESRGADMGRLVECFVLTPEKARAMGIGTKRLGAWVGFKVTDPDAWERVKSGRRRFSMRVAVR